MSNKMKTKNHKKAPNNKAYIEILKHTRDSLKQLRHKKKPNKSSQTQTECDTKPTTSKCLNQEDIKIDVSLEEDEPIEFVDNQADETEEDIIVDVNQFEIKYADKPGEPSFNDAESNIDPTSDSSGDLQPISDISAENINIDKTYCKSTLSEMKKYDINLSLSVANKTRESEEDEPIDERDTNLLVQNLNKSRASADEADEVDEDIEVDKVEEDIIGAIEVNNLEIKYDAGEQMYQQYLSSFDESTADTFLMNYDAESDNDSSSDSSSYSQSFHQPYNASCADISTANIGNIYYKYTYPVSSSDMIELETFQSRRKKAVDADLQCLLYSSSSSDDECNNVILCGDLLKRYNVIYECKNDIKCDDPAQYAIGFKPDTFIQAMNNVSTTQLIARYKLVSFLMNKVKHNEWNGKFQHLWAGLDEDCIIYHVTPPKLQNKLLSPQRNTKCDRFVLEGGAVKEFESVIQVSTPCTNIIVIDKLGSNMFIDIVFETGTECKTIRMDDRGCIYTNGEYNETMIPYKFNFIDSGSQIAITCQLSDTIANGCFVMFEHNKKQKLVCQSKNVGIQFKHTVNPEDFLIKIVIGQYGGNGIYSVLYNNIN